MNGTLSAGLGGSWHGSDLKFGNLLQSARIDRTMDILSEIMIARRVVRLTSPLASARARNWLAAANDMTPRSTLRIAPIDQPELPMPIRFEGISVAEQRAALAAFPGGKRFVLEG